MKGPKPKYHQILALPFSFHSYNLKASLVTRRLLLQPHKYNVLYGNILHTSIATLISTMQIDCR